MARDHEQRKIRLEAQLARLKEEEKVINTIYPTARTGFSRVFCFSTHLSFLNLNQNQRNSSQTFAVQEHAAKLAKREEAAAVQAKLDQQRQAELKEQKLKALKEKKIELEEEQKEREEKVRRLAALPLFPPFSALCMCTA